MKSRHATTRLTAVVFGLALLGAACSNDASESASAAAGPTTQEQSENATFCDSWVQVDQTAGELSDPDTPMETVTASASKISDLLAAADEPPADLATQLDTLTSAIDAAADGDRSQLDAPETAAPWNEVGLWVHDNCGFEPVEITLVEHEFEGMPTSLDAGVASLKATNEGVDAHVMIISRIKDDVELSAQEIVDSAMEADDPEAAFEKTTEEVVGGGFAAPGDQAALTVDLTPGRYVMLCPIPSGFSGDGPPPADAPPHFALGMVSGFQVN